MVWVTQGQTFASPIDRAVFLQPPVGFCSEMSTLAPIAWATAGKCVQTHQLKKKSVVAKQDFFSIFEKTSTKSI